MRVVLLVVCYLDGRTAPRTMAMDTFREVWGGENVVKGTGTQQQQQQLVCYTMPLPANLPYICVRYHEKIPKGSQVLEPT